MTRREAKLMPWQTPTQVARYIGFIPSRLFGTDLLLSIVSHMAEFRQQLRRNRLAAVWDSQLRGETAAVSLLNRRSSG